MIQDILPRVLRLWDAESLRKDFSPGMYLGETIQIFEDLLANKAGIQGSC